MSPIEQAIYDAVRSAVRDELREQAPARVAGAEPAPDLVKIGQVKRWVQISTSTVKKWIADGDLKKYGKGRVALVRLDDVHAMLVRRAKVAEVAPVDRAGAILSTIGRRRVS